MRIGLTFDLRSQYLAAGYGEEETAEFDRDDTIVALEKALAAEGHETVRIGHVRALVERLAAGERWDLVFNIAEGLRGVSREAQVPAILEAYDIAYTFSDPLVMSLSLHKAMTKSAVRSARIPTADDLTVERLSDLDALTLPFPLFAKPLAEGTGKGVSSASLAANGAELREVCMELLEKFAQPVLVETYLPGREFTVSVLGEGEETEVLGTLEIVLLEGAEPNAYSYVNKENCEELVDYRLVSADDPLVATAEKIAVRAWKALGGRDAGRIDLRCDEHGMPHFLEANPLSGLHPHHSDLPMLCTRIGMSYEELIRRIVASAAKRRRAADPRAETLARLAREARGNA